MAKQVKISGAAMMALAWFAGVTGSFGDVLDRTPEAALVYELRAAGLLSPAGMPTAKGDALLAEMAKPLPKKGEARKAFQAAFAKSETSGTASGQGAKYAWMPVELDGIGRKVEIRAARFGARNILGFELRGALYVCRATKAGPILKTRTFAPKLDLNNWIDTLIEQRNEVLAYA